jgi:hypothetical protein
VRMSGTQKIVASLLVMAALAACGDRKAADADGKGEALTVVGAAEEPVEDYPVPPAALQKVDPSDAVINQPGAGRDGTLVVKDDPAAQDVLVGSWATAKASCNSGEAIRFSGDGTYGFEGESGKWVLAGDALRFEEVKVFDESTGAETPGDPSTVKLLEVGADKMAWQAPSGPKQDYVRCMGVQ